MPRYKPVILPEAFYWEHEDHTAVLRCHGIEVLRVVPLKAGWAVDLQVHDRAGASHRIIAPSRIAGISWGAKWAKGRLTYLQKIGG